MLEIVDLLEKRKSELESSLNEAVTAISNPSYHSTRTSQALQDAVGKIKSDNKETIISQLLGILNQMPEFVEDGFRQQQLAISSIKAKIDEVNQLKESILEKVRLKQESQSTRDELIQKIESGEITEETITGKREPGTRPESLATFRKLTQNR